MPIQPKGARPPLFFVHAHGGEVLGYRDLALRLGADQPFYGLQAPEPAPGEAAETRIDLMARRYVREVRAFRPHGPYLLGGWCLGGMVAVEMARVLAEAGEQVALVALVQTAHPDYDRPRPGVTAVGRLMGRVAQRLGQEVSTMREGPVSGRPRWLMDRVARAATLALIAGEERLAGAAQRVGLRLPRSRAATLERRAGARQRAYVEFRPGPYAGRTLILRARHQPYGILPDPTLGWAEYLGGDLEVREMPGYPVGLLSPPRVDLVADVLRDAIGRALQTGRPAAERRAS